MTDQHEYPTQSKSHTAVLIIVVAVIGFFATPFIIYSLLKLLEWISK